MSMCVCVCEYVSVSVYVCVNVSQVCTWACFDFNSRKLKEIVMNVCLYCDAPYVREAYFRKSTLSLSISLDAPTCGIFAEPEPGCRINMRQCVMVV